jgi:hypothetical protein
MLAEPLTVRSALFGRVHSLGGNNPEVLGGARLMFSDGADYCAYMGRVREAQARGEPTPQPPPDARSLLIISLGGPDVEPGVVTGGTYAVRAADEPYGLYPLEANAFLSTQALETSGSATAGTAEVTRAPMEAGAELTGEVRMQFAGPERRGGLHGEFTATYCEYL